MDGRTGSRFLRVVQFTALQKVGATLLLSPRGRVAVLRRLGLDLAEDVRIKAGCYFRGPKLSIGPGSEIESSCVFLNDAQITIGARTGLGMETMVLTGSHEIGGSGGRSGQFAPLPVTIGDGCWIGARVTILPGVKIGDGCVIMAGSLVTGSCLPHAIYGGSPAELIRRLQRPAPEAQADAAPIASHRAGQTSAPQWPTGGRRLSRRTRRRVPHRSS